MTTRKSVLVAALALLLVTAASTQSYDERYENHRLRPVDPATAQREAQAPYPAQQRPRPDLACRRLRQPGDGHIYLINPEGTRQMVPNEYTYNLLFRDWSGIFDDQDLNEIPRAADLSNGATLVQGTGQDQIYLVSNGQKRWVTSPAVMDRCNFKWAAKGSTPPSIVDAIPTGANWTVR